MSAYLIRRNCRSRSAFTLIELLVVISIIAILIGILIPVLSLARSTAQQLACSSIVRQIAIGHEVFATDYKDDYPIAGAEVLWGGIDPVTQAPSWMEQVDEYISAKATDTADPEPFYSGCPTYPQSSPYHYFLSGRAAWVETGGQFAAVERQRIRTPSHFILGGDFNRIYFNMDDADKDDYTQQVLGWDEFRFGNPDFWEPHHNGGLNIQFADGHVALEREFDDTRMTLRYDLYSAW